MTTTTSISAIKPDWPQPETVTAFTTTRQSGISTGNYASLNLGQNCGDDPTHIEHNRHLLQQQFDLPQQPAWLQQVHGNDVMYIDTNYQLTAADASYTDKPSCCCVVTTADCLPILVCHRQGNAVAAIHAGWRGLLNSVIENTFAKLNGKTKDYLVWLGPAIGSQNFLVQSDVYTAFIEDNASAKTAFKQTDATHWSMDIYALAKQRLHACGIKRIYGGDYCTYQQADLFYSYRRDGQTGRMASLIYIHSS